MKDQENQLKVKYKCKAKPLKKYSLYENACSSSAFYYLLLINLLNCYNVYTFTYLYSELTCAVTWHQWWWEHTISIKVQKVTTSGGRDPK